MTRKIHLVPLFLISLMLLVLPPGQGRGEEFAKIPDDATAVALDGKTVSLADYRGKLVFMNIWKTDCIPCLMEIPILNRLQKEYSSDEFTVIGVAMDRGKEKLIQELAKRAEINYPIWLSYGQPLSKYIEPPLTPFLLVLGPGGEVLGYIPGKIPTYKDAVSVMNQARAIVAEHKSGK